MRERRRREEHENHERWLISYADFITLLFAFFVVMYAISSINKKKYDELTSSLGTAFGGVSVIKVNPPTTIVKKPEPIAQDKMVPLIKNLKSTLSPLIDSGNIIITESAKGIRIDLYDSLLFPSGSAKLSSSVAIKTLEMISPLLLDNDFPIEVEGHTDNRPINNHEYSSNWELSAIRATSVLEFFIRSGVEDERLSAIGFGASRPLVENLDVAGEARNRRVSVMILREKRDPI